MGFSRQGYWSGLPFPSPGDLPDPGIEPGSPALQADSLPSELQGKSDYDEAIFGDHQNYGREACTWRTIVLDVQFGVFQMRINPLNKCVAMNKEDMKVLKL